MINRLRAGETNVWDLINVNNPWARKVMYPEGLIKPLDRAQFEPYFDKMMPAFKPPYKWAMSDDGKELLGMCQRFGPYSFVVNTDKISRATAEDQGWDLWNDPANAGKYGVLESDDWNVFNICCIAGFDPFREHTDEEVAKFTEAAKPRVQGREARWQTSRTSIRPSSPAKLISTLPAAPIPARRHGPTAISISAASPRRRARWRAVRAAFPGSK